MKTFISAIALFCLSTGVSYADLKPENYPLLLKEANNQVAAKKENDPAWVEQISLVKPKGSEVKMMALKFSLRQAPYYYTILKTTPSSDGSKEYRITRGSLKRDGRYSVMITHTIKVAADQTVTAGSWFKGQFVEPMGTMGVPSENPEDE